MLENRSNPIKQNFIPPKPRMIALLCAVALAVTLGFTILLVVHLRSPKPLDPADYEQYAPESFDFTCAAEVRQGNLLVLEGYAVDTTDYLVEVNNFVVLHNRATGTYLRLPTAMTESPEAEEKYGTSSRYAKSGYYAFIYPSQAEYAPEDSELCFAYRSNKSNWLIHTGLKLADIGITGG